MGSVYKRTWKTRGATKVRREAWGYSLVVRGRQERVIRMEWTKDDAQNALTARMLERDVVRTPAPATMTFGDAVARYTQEKARKRTVSEDVRHLTGFAAEFGVATPLAEITAARISAWRGARLAALNPRTKRPYSAAAINRPLATLRHLFALAHKDGEVISGVPRVRREKEPQGRLRWLTREEVTRLLGACDASKNPFLGALVRLALATGMRRGELLGLTWERVDFGRGVVQLELTKSGQRRDIPMNRDADAALTGLPGPKAEGFVFRKRDGRAWGRIRTAFESAVRTAKIEDFTFHDVRHTRSRATSSWPRATWWPSRRSSGTRRSQ